MARKRKPEQFGSTEAAVAVTEAVPFTSDAAPDLGSGATAERVRQRAQEIYERRMALGLPGEADADWFQAEAELAKGEVPKASA